VEFEGLKSSGVIKKSDSCQWETSFVLVLKANGKICLCADYIATINRFIKDVHYPFPRIEELFATAQEDSCFQSLISIMHIINLRLTVIPESY